MRYPTNDAVGTPLALEIAATALRKKTFEKKRQVEADSGLKTGQELKGTRRNRAKTMIIPLAPNQKLTEI